jgi:hypothetical protein
MRRLSLRRLPSYSVTIAYLSDPITKVLQVQTAFQIEDSAQPA